MKRAPVAAVRSSRSAAEHRIPARFTDLGAPSWRRPHGTGYRQEVVAKKIHFKSCPCVRTPPTSTFHFGGLSATSGVSQATLALATVAIFLLHTVCYALLRRIVLAWHTTCTTPKCGHESQFTY